MTATSPDQKSWRSRAGRFVLLALCFFLVGSVSLVMIFRFAPVHFSGLMVQRSIESVFDDRMPDQRRQQWVTWEAISKSMPMAVIASEDQKFLTHYGFDFDQMKKAFDVHQRGGRLRGASTISQQTAKNLFLWSGRSFIRKGLEAWFTLLIEVLWPKERILEVYLNIIEFGPGIYGVEAASQTFFHKRAKNLTRYEAALLAAVLPNPLMLKASTPTPYLRERQAWILRQMQQLGGEGRLVKVLNS